MNVQYRKFDSVLRISLLCKKQNILLIYSLDKIVRDVIVESALARGELLSNHRAEPCRIRPVKTSQKMEIIWSSLWRKGKFGMLGLGRLWHILVTSSFLAQILQKNIAVVNNTGYATSASVMDMLQLISNHPAPQQARWNTRNDKKDASIAAIFASGKNITAHCLGGYLNVF